MKDYQNFLIYLEHIQFLNYLSYHSSIYIVNLKKTKILIRISLKHQLD